MLILKYFLIIGISVFIASIGSPVLAAYDLEVPANPWEEYRAQFKTYSKHLLASYDKAFVDDYQAAIREVGKAIELLPEEGIGYAERGKYFRMLNNAEMAEADFKQSLLMFNQALDRYQPGGDKKNKKNDGRKVDRAEAGKLIATLHYQRGEAFFSFEKYKEAAEDFNVSCQSGNAVACNRLWDVKAVEVRGSNWVPISTLQFYDRLRVVRPSGDNVKVWVRRENSQPVRGELSAVQYMQQHLELNCSTREYRQLEVLVASGSRKPAVPQKAASTRFEKPLPGSAPSKLLMLFCGGSRLK